MKRQGREKKLGTKISLLAGTIFLISIAAVMFLCTFLFQRLIVDMLEGDCVSGTNLLAFELSKQSSPDQDLNRLLDDLKAQTGDEFTIFSGDERAFTTITQNGQRAVGTKLSGEIADIVLNQGKAYVGEASILGMPHLCSYVPTRDGNGQVDGLLFAGVRSSEANARMRNAVTYMTLAGVLVLLAGLLFLRAYLKRAISRPLQQLTSFAKTVEEGDLGLSSGVEKQAGIPRQDEIGVLAGAFELTIHRMKAYIEEIGRILSAISDKDLTVGTTLDYVGDFASLQISLREITDRLNQAMRQVADASGQVMRGADMVSSGAQGLSAGAAEEAGSVEELATTLAIVSDQAAQTADNAQRADESSQEAARKLQDGRLHMEQMVSAMDDIDHSSQEIEKVIKVIEDIAFQTNILALNAAVEAARAGAAGKGFSVVADEVRALAAKSAEASQTTAQLIRDAIQSVRHGSEIAAKTARLIETVASSSNETAGLIRQISGISQDQALQVAQIKDGVERISAVIQTTSSTAEESAAVSEELSQQAKQLEQLVRQFRLS